MIETDNKKYVCIEYPHYLKIDINFLNNCAYYCEENDSYFIEENDWMFHNN